jgi:hypothetical protein
VLNAYLTSTALLLQNPAAPTPLYSTQNLTSFINTARGQLAGESESVRFLASLTLVPGQRVYPFSAINLSGSTGILEVLKVQTLWYQAASGQKWVTPRSFEWFSLYNFNAPVPLSGEPETWAQYGQGVNGSIYIDPLPDIAYTVLLDCICIPVPLVDDTTPEAIPFMWTDAVPYFAAYMALLSSQGTLRQQDAQRMFQVYTEFSNRARRFATPGVLAGQYEQQNDPTRMNQLGQAPARGAPAQ